MRIAEHLGDRGDSARFESAITLCQGGDPVWNLAQGRTKEHDVEGRLRDARLRRITEDGLFSDPRTTRPGRRARVVEDCRSGQGWESATPDWGISNQLARTFGIPDKMVATSLSVSSPL